MKNTSFVRPYAGALIIALVLAGCGDKDEKTATQVAAQVNGEEITVHQINFAMQRMSNVAPEQAKETSIQVLKGLVDKQLLVQQALEDKLIETRKWPRPWRKAVASSWPTPTSNASPPMPPNPRTLKSRITTTRILPCSPSGASTSCRNL